MTVRFRYPPGAGRALAYQKYYLLGLAARTRLRVEGAPLHVRLAPGLLNKVRVAYRTAGEHAEGYVGRYLADSDGRHVRFAIDAHDGREVHDPQALEWADVYFKANRWPEIHYDPKVRPIVNGNGLVDARKLRLLRTLRTVEKTVDVVYLANVWGGREHSLRVFERIAGLDCSKDLLAVFPEGFPAEEDAEHMERLGVAGVTVTRTPLRPRELWQRLSRARLVPLRAGKHLCFSWRTIDLLAMGACIVFDALPPPRWPVPLEPGVHVADCGIARPDDTEAAPKEEYEKLPATIEALLRAPEEQVRLRRAAARYFDEHAAPEQVAASTLSRLR